MGNKYIGSDFDDFLKQEGIKIEDKMITKMIEDKREILSIWDQEGLFKVGLAGITRIEIYQEKCEFGFSNYAAVFEGDILTNRVDMRGWGITYMDTKQ